MWKSQKKKQMEVILAIFYIINRNKTFLGYKDSAYNDLNYWNNLHKVKISNMSCSEVNYYKFILEEIKRKRSTYIYINPPTSYSSFSSLKN